MTHAFLFSAEHDSTDVSDRGVIFVIYSLLGNRRIVQQVA